MKKIIILLALLTLAGCNSTEKKVVCGDFDTGWSDSANIHEFRIIWRKDGLRYYRAIPADETCIEYRRNIK